MITKADREKLNGNRSLVLWITGLSGAGKTTLARALENALFAQGVRAYVLDGDIVRKGISVDLEFDEAGRNENVRRIAEVAKLIADSGIIPIVSLISPLLAQRKLAREIVGEYGFVEVFCSTPIDICESRDPKGLYVKARNGLLKDFTGVSSPYEKPTSPEILVGGVSLSSDVSLVLSYLSNKIFI